MFCHGHTLWIENSFKSLELERKLNIDHYTDCAGTLKLSIKNIPKEMKDKKLEKGEIIARYSAPVTVLKWRDKSNVIMLSTYQSTNTQRVYNKGKETEKLLCFIDYNHKIMGVGLKDQVLHMYMVDRKKMTKWYIKLFKRLLNGTVHFSFLVYLQVTGRSIQQRSYRIQLVECLFTKYACAAETLNEPGRQASDKSVPRLTERYFLTKLAPKTEKSKLRRKFYLCSKDGN